jgi:nitronate monooxygenase
MHNLGTPELAAAVSNAGGWHHQRHDLSHPDELRAAIRRVKAMTDKPFCVNVTLIPAWPWGRQPTNSST